MVRADASVRGSSGKLRRVIVNVLESAIRDRFFEPFFQGGPDAWRSGPGAGLGVSIFRLIVEAHGGRIWLDDAVRRTRIRFSLQR